METGASTGSMSIGSTSAGNVRSVEARERYEHCEHVRHECREHHGYSRYEFHECVERHGCER